MCIRDRSSDRLPNVPSSLSTVVCIEPAPGPRSTLEESPTTVAVASLTGETDDVEPEGLAGLEFPLPYGPSGSVQSNPRDHSGVVPREASGTAGLEDKGADDTVQGCILQVPEGVIPAEGWKGWSPTAFREEVQEAVEVLLQDEPTGLPATSPVRISTSPPRVVQFPCRLHQPRAHRMSLVQIARRRIHPHLLSRFCHYQFACR